MKRFIKFLFLYIVLFVVALVLTVGIGTCSSIGTSAEAGSFFFSYLLLPISALYWFIFVLTSLSEFPAGQILIEILGFILGMVGLGMMEDGSTWASIGFMFLCVCITSIPACNFFDSFSYLKEITTTELYWDDFEDDFKEGDSKTVVQKVDESWIGFLIHVVIFILLPALSQSNTFIWVARILLIIRTTLRGFIPGLIALIAAANSGGGILSIILLPIKILLKFWYATIILIVVLIIILCNVNGCSGCSKCSCDCNFDTVDINEEDIYLVSQTDYTLINEPNCTTLAYPYSDVSGIDRETGSSYSNQYTSTLYYKHDYDKYGYCTKCGDHLNFDSTHIIYKEFSDHCVIYGILVDNIENIIIPPYINGLPVTTIYLRAYNPLYIKDRSELVYASRLKEYNYIKNHYITTDYYFSNIVVYTYNSDVDIYFGTKLYVYTDNTNNYDYINLLTNNLTIYGEVNNFYRLTYANARNMNFYNNVNRYYENIDSGHKVFLGGCTEFRSDADSHSEAFIVPKNLKFFYTKLTYLNYILNYSSDYFKVINGSLQTRELIYYKYYLYDGEKVSAKSKDNSLKKYESTYKDSYFSEPADIYGYIPY